MEECPHCHLDAGVFVVAPLAIREGRVCEGRVQAFCNNPNCDGRFWWFPWGRRVTKRNTGLTYREYRQREGR